MSEQLAAILNELRGYVEALYGPRLVQIVLYGSQARGDAAADSDIDVLIILRGPVQPGEEIARTSAFVAELSLRYDEVISCAFVSSERFHHEGSPFLMNVRREGVRL